MTAHEWIEEVRALRDKLHVSMKHEKELEAEIQRLKVELAQIRMMPPLPVKRAAWG